MRPRNKIIALGMTAALVVAACGSDTKKGGGVSTTPVSAAATSTPASGSTPTSGSTVSTASAVSTPPGKANGTLVFGASADPVVLDGAYVSDGESLRVIQDRGQRFSRILARCQAEVFHEEDVIRACFDARSQDLIAARRMLPASPYFSKSPNAHHTTPRVSSEIPTSTAAARKLKIKS